MNRELSSFEDDFVRNSDKIRRLSETNENTFKKVWQLNEKRAMKLLIKVKSDFISEVDLFFSI